MRQRFPFEIEKSSDCLKLRLHPLPVVLLGFIAGPMLVDGGDESLLGTSQHVISRIAGGGGAGIVAEAPREAHVALINRAKFTTS